MPMREIALLNIDRIRLDFGAGHFLHVDYSPTDLYAAVL